MVETLKKLTDKHEIHELFSLIYIYIHILSTNEMIHTSQKIWPKSASAQLGSKSHPQTSKHMVVWALSLRINGVRGCLKQANLKNYRGLSKSPGSMAHKTRQTNVVSLEFMEILLILLCRKFDLCWRNGVCREPGTGAWAPWKLEWPPWLCS